MAVFRCWFEGSFPDDILRTVAEGLDGSYSFSRIASMTLIASVPDEKPPRVEIQTVEGVEQEEALEILRALRSLSLFRGRRIKAGLEQFVGQCMLGHGIDT